MLNLHMAIFIVCYIIVAFAICAALRDALGRMKAEAAMVPRWRQRTCSGFIGYTPHTCPTCKLNRRMRAFRFGRYW